MHTLEALRESWHSWLERQAAEKEEKAKQERLAMECLRRHGEAVVAQQEAKRRRLHEHMRKLQEQRKATAAAAKAEAKKKRSEEKAAANNAALLRCTRVAYIASRLRQSKYWCDCGCLVHPVSCLIRDGCNSVLWFGVDAVISREELGLHYANNGRVVKAAGNC